MSWEIGLGVGLGLAIGFFIKGWAVHYKGKYERKLRELKAELLDNKEVILTFPGMTADKWNHIKNAIKELEQAGVDFDYRTDKKLKIHQWGFSNDTRGVYITKGGK